MEMQANLHPAQSAKWISTFKVGAHTFICYVTTHSGLVELVHRHLQATEQHSFAQLADVQEKPHHTTLLGCGTPTGSVCGPDRTCPILSLCTVPSQPVAV